MRESAETVPKPLVEIGGRPVLWHVMCLYASQGLTRFLLLTGHGGERIQAFADSLASEWEVECIDTGLDTNTGGRVHRAAERLGGGTFCLTYADGLADLDMRALLEFHRSHGRAATMTVVRPRNPWGVAQLRNDGRVDGFEEKPRLDSWVNGGFCVMEPAALGFIGPDDVLERRPFESMASAGELYAYRHEGFWDCMDTYKDTLLLNELWDRGDAPWRAFVEA
ncbi:MAG: sugar phosphate nucleotidyltransferase [Thermoleophilaceae bacterium]